MKRYVTIDPWNIIEDGFHPEFNRVSESMFSLGNGHMGHRGTFEEQYSGDTLQGSYMAGVYYPDKTIVGWWKVGYPEYFAKIPNSTDWLQVQVTIDGTELDLGTLPILSFRRILDMKRGMLSRLAEVKLPSGIRVKIEAERFVSLVRREVGVLRYRITADRICTIKVQTGLQGNVRNEDANYGEQFWTMEGEGLSEDIMVVCTATRKTRFHLTCAAAISYTVDGLPCSCRYEKGPGEMLGIVEAECSRLEVEKFVVCATSRDVNPEQLSDHVYSVMDQARACGYDELLEEHRQAWALRWDHSDITIEGSDEAQQGIRFAIFQLHQTYSGHDERLNIGPKGFTGEKYGGGTYWDTEAYCVPFYLSTAGSAIARNLLLYRYRHLEQAKENARAIGIGGGAALYPMVTMDGQECHNEWEITFEEIHRNGAIVYAIWNYLNFTGDWDYLVHYGLEVMIAVCRFWVRRVSLSPAKQQYVLLGVTGPNEYENNVQNNWYTNRIASWCLEWTSEAAEYIKSHYESQYEKLCRNIGLDDKELEQFNTVAQKMYLPEEIGRGIFLQQDGYLDKEDLTVSDLTEEDLPLNQKWSWDRILRSCFIKQADVLQGLFFFENAYNMETIERNFDYYEPKTVHESSLSPCIHSILAARLGRMDKAYELYLRTARLDLEDYNHDTRDGCHITSMSGTWMAIVIGFGGLRSSKTMLELAPSLPDQWNGYTFKVLQGNTVLKTDVNRQVVRLENQGPESICIQLYGEKISLSTGQTVNRRRTFSGIRRRSEG